MYSLLKRLDSLGRRVYQIIDGTANERTVSVTIFHDDDE